MKTQYKDISFLERLKFSVLSEERARILWWILYRVMLEYIEMVDSNQ